MDYPGSHGQLFPSEGLNALYLKLDLQKVQCLVVRCGEVSKLNIFFNDPGWNRTRTYGERNGGPEGAHTNAGGEG